MEELKELYSKASIKKEELNKNKVSFSFVPAICGANYNSSSKKIMVVGRAPNGWSMKSYHNGSRPENWFEAKLSWVYQDGPVRCDNGEQHEASVKWSKFWQFIRYNLSLQCSEIDRNTFSDMIVWTNLYKISPKSSGNPSDHLCRDTCELMDKILLAEIKYYCPDEIWFITKNKSKQPEDGDMCRWIRKKEFPKTIDWLKNNNDKLKAFIYLRPEFTKFETVGKERKALN